MKKKLSNYYIWTLLFFLLLIILSISGIITTKTSSFEWLPVLTEGHLLGTDGAGRDMLKILIVGVGNNLIVSSVAAVISLLFGGLLGISLGYTLPDGTLKSILVSFTRIIKSVPLLIWIFLIVFWIELLGIYTSIFDNEMIKMVWVFAIFGGIYSFNFALLLMGHIQKLKAAQFIEACEFIGLNKKTIIFKHIIWHHSNSLFLSQASYIFAQCIFMEMTISFHKIDYGFDNKFTLGTIFNRAAYSESYHILIPLTAGLILTTLFSYFSQSLEKKYQKI
tara:strand:+ start:90 stop:923 length:834 start_codon:yes stop_codon:yes gene_type:complete